MRFNLLIRVHSSGNLTKRLSSSRQVPSIQANPEGTSNNRSSRDS